MVQPIQPIQPSNPIQPIQSNQPLSGSLPIQRIKRICFLVNYNLYDSKLVFTEGLVEALRKLNVAVKTINTEKKGLQISDIDKIQDFNPTITCSFNSILPLSQTDKHYLWDEFQIPHLFILLDPAIYELDLIKSPYLMISCVDHFDCNLLKRYGFNRTFFLPHGISKDIQNNKFDESIDGYDVVLMGSCYDHEHLRQQWRSQFSVELSNVIENAIEMALSDRGMHFVEATTESLFQVGINPKEIPFTELCFYVDYASRSIDRCRLIKSIKNIKVHVFGEIVFNSPEANSWTHYLKDCPNVFVHSGVPFNESLKILKNSKFCLNSIPFFRNGSHERILTGLSSDCAIISSENQYIQDHFKEEDGVFTYKHLHRDSVNDLINELLVNDSYRKSCIERGKQKVFENHTWDHRASELIENVNPMIESILF